MQEMLDGYLPGPGRRPGGKTKPRVVEKGAERVVSAHGRRAVSHGATEMAMLARCGGWVPVGLGSWDVVFALGLLMG